MSLREFANARSRSKDKKRTRQRHDSTSSSSSSSTEQRRKRTKKDRKRKSAKTHKSKQYSSSSTDSSSPHRKRKSKHKDRARKKKKKHKKDKQSKRANQNNILPSEPDLERKQERLGIPGPSMNDKPTKRIMAPMTKEEFELQQSKIRRVFDPDTGRNRLVKGDGEILEEIVSYDRHKMINKIATFGDGASFQANLAQQNK